MIDIIIPVYNEAEILLKKSSYFRSFNKKANLIFVDGGSQDDTAQIASSLGELVLSAKGRGLQKNKGAQVAKSDYLLFLHVDTEIKEEVIQKIKETLDQKQNCVGSLFLRIDGKGFIFSFFQFVTNWRAKYFGVLDGDLGLFIKKDTFKRIGQFDLLPFMEDIVFSKKIRRFAKLVILPDQIVVSSRKWETHGFIKTFNEYAWAYFHLWTNFRFLSKAGS